VDQPPRLRSTSHTECEAAARFITDLSPCRRPEYYEPVELTDGLANDGLGRCQMLARRPATRTPVCDRIPLGPESGVRACGAAVVVTSGSTLDARGCSGTRSAEKRFRARSCQPWPTPSLQLLAFCLVVGGGRSQPRPSVRVGDFGGAQSPRWPGSAPRQVACTKAREARHLRLEANPTSLSTVDGLPINLSRERGSAGDEESVAAGRIIVYPIWLSSVSFLKEWGRSRAAGSFVWAFSFSPTVYG